MPAFQHNRTSGFEPSDFLNSFFRTVKAVLLSPAQFYDSVKGQKGLQVPFIFLSCCALVHTFVVGISLRNGTVVAVSLINGIAMPFATAGLLFLVLTRLFKTPGTYEQTFMVVAYSGATALFSWIPLAGFFLELYRAYVIALGLSHVFSIKTSKAVLAIVIVVIAYVIGFSTLTQIMGGHWPKATP